MRNMIIIGSNISKNSRNASIVTIKIIPSINPISGSRMLKIPIILLVEKLNVKSLSIIIKEQILNLFNFIILEIVIKA